MNESLQTARNCNLERLRIVAIFGIVWFHFEHIHFRIIAYSGLPVFLLLSAALAARSGGGGFITFAKKRWDRLMVPWIVWCLIYSCPKLFDVIVRHEDVSDVFTWPMALSGTRAQLWYLPFIFLVSLGIYPALNAVKLLSPVRVVLVVVALGCFGIVSSSLLLQYHTRIPDPFKQWIFALPAVALGFALGRVQGAIMPGHKKLFFTGIGIATVLLCLVLFVAGFHKLAIPYACGTVLVCGAFIGPGNKNPFMVSWAPLTFGIYLMYPLASYVPDVIMPSAALEMKAVVTFTLSLAAAFVIGKTPARRFI
jgi:fucose 4-O-acetylase-like acetyltransferase